MVGDVDIGSQSNIAHTFGDLLERADCLRKPFSVADLLGSAKETQNLEDICGDDI